VAHHDDVGSLVDARSASSLDRFGRDEAGRPRETVRLEERLPVVDDLHSPAEGARESDQRDGVVARPAHQKPERRDEDLHEDPHVALETSPADGADGISVRRYEKPGPLATIGRALDPDDGCQRELIASGPALFDGAEDVLELAHDVISVPRKHVREWGEAPGY